MIAQQSQFNHRVILHNPSSGLHAAAKINFKPPPIAPDSPIPLPVRDIRRFKTSGAVGFFLLNAAGKKSYTLFSRLRAPCIGGSKMPLCKARKS